ncbi:alpha/beta fold hydrolase [Actinoplanes sp. RD1]|uniref:alpha/beta fold hydrolase n=1 Tax=Actinoplanes sp. RD1 TaxID=3064538 RepID=UPI002741D4C0|nr:alpha/beta hydrolase [Actinoplanes sp. RD1]
MTVRRVLAVLLGIVVVLVGGLAVWDGSPDLDPRRELLPGIALDLRTAETVRGPIEYDLSGTGGPVVLSVHAGLGGADQGRLFASRLTGFRILSPSRPGYLGTPLGSGRRTVEEQADLLVALLDALGIERAGVFAASAGSPVAYMLAARHPDRVWGLVSVGGVSLADPDASPSSRGRTLFLNLFGQKLAKLTATVSLETIVRGTLDETSTFTEEQKAQRVAYILGTPGVRDFFAASFATTFPYEKRLPGTANDARQRRTLSIPFERIRAPALIVHGTRDGDVPFADGRHAAGAIRGARHLWLTDDDHLGFWLGPGAGAAQRTASDFLHAAAAEQARGS